MSASNSNQLEVFWWRHNSFRATEIDFITIATLGNATFWNLYQVRKEKRCRCFYQQEVFLVVDIEWCYQ